MLISVTMYLCRNSDAVNGYLFRCTQHNNITCIHSYDKHDEHIYFDAHITIALHVYTYDKHQ